MLLEGRVLVGNRGVGTSCCLKGRVVVGRRVFGRTCCWKVVSLLVVVLLEGRVVESS